MTQTSTPAATYHVQPESTEEVLVSFPVVVSYVEGRGLRFEVCAEDMAEVAAEAGASPKFAAILREYAATRSTNLEITRATAS